MTLSSMGNIRKPWFSKLEDNFQKSSHFPGTAFEFLASFGKNTVQFVNISVTIVNYYHNRSALLKIDQITRTEDFENICSKCAKLNAEHPATGRFSTIVLFGDECA
jgi:hypothetical protein